MTAEQLLIKTLIANIDHEFSAIEAIFLQIQTFQEEIKDINPGLRDKAAMGYFLHNLYSAFENIFLNIARHFENHLNNKKGWHAELLRKMKIKIDDIRPAVLSEQAYQAMDELRRFRHIFRYSYDFELDWDRMKLVLKRSDELHKIYQKELNQFQNFLNQLIKS